MPCSSSSCNPPRTSASCSTSCAATARTSPHSSDGSSLTAPLPPDPVQPKRHVLVADDEPHIGRIIQTKLELGPFRVTLVYDGAEALRALEQYPDVALVLLDLMMPTLGGLEVLTTMRRDARWSALPCIIMTAAGQEQ